MIAVLRSLFVLLCLLAAIPAQDKSETLRVGTWNLEFLGAEGSYRSNLPPRDDADYAAIGKKVRELGVAVLAVQEVCGTAPLAKVTAAAGPAWKFVLGTSGRWNEDQLSQQLGFVYDSSRVELLFVDELLQLPREIEGLPIFHRVPLTAAFRSKATGFDFRAITVHLKAGRKEQDLQKRGFEAGYLRDWLQGLRERNQEDHDIVLLGDFNSTFGDSPQTLLESGGGLQYLQTSPRRPTILHFDDPVDHVVVGREFHEVQRRTFTVHDDLGGLARDAWRKTYSDHLPVTIDLLASGDDDPAATFKRDGTSPPGAAQAPSPQVAVPTPASAGAPVTTGVRRAAWPPQAGQRVRVVYGLHGDLRNEHQAEGSLLEALPSTARGGWVVLQSTRGVLAIPIERVVSIELL